MTFQICSKNLFLTYPECPLGKEIVYEKLHELFHLKEEEKLLVAEEKHANGNPHIHAYIGLQDAFRTRCGRFADIEGYHGNYQGCRSAKNVLKYCTKEDNFKANFDVEQILSKSESKKTILGKRLLDGENLMQIVKENPELIFGFKRLKEDIDCLQECMHFQNFEFEMPGTVPNPWGKTFPIDTDNKKCHYWFYSTMANKGKTTGVILPLIRNHHATLFSPTALYHDIRKEVKTIVMDEVRKGSIKYEILNSLCDGTYRFRVFMRGNVALEEKPIVIICSNFSIKEVFPFKFDLIEARFNEICVDNF